MWSQISLSPNNGDPGTSFSVTITGAAFAGSSTMQCIEVSDGTTTFSFNASSPASPTMSITGTMNIPATARPGSGYDVTVYSNNSCSGGVDGSCTDCFTVNSPNNISATPNNGDQNSSFGVTITAIGFQFAGTPTTQCVEIYNNNTSYTFNGSSAASPTSTLSGTLNVPLNAAPGLYNAVVYDNLGGICSGSYTGSCVDCFTINAIPQVTSLSPNSGDRGDSFGITITGIATSWSGTHCVEISNATTTLTFPATANSNTELEGTIDIPLDASVGNDYDVVVYADDSGVCAGSTDGDCMNCFAVTEPTPMGNITPNPNQGNAGETFGVSLTGIGTSWASLTSHCVEIFDDAENTIIQFTTDVASSDFNFMSGSLSISFATPPGFYNMRVYDRNDGVCSDALDGSCTDCFQILPPLPPSVTMITPNSGDRGDSFGVTITGNNTSWSGTHCVEISNASSTFTFSGTANSSTEIVGTLDIPLDAVVAGDYDIAVYADPTGDCNGNTDGTCTDCFAVTNPTPMGNIIPNPDTELAGETFGVSLTGLGTTWASLTSHCVEIYDDSETTVIQFTMNVASTDFNFMTGTTSLPFATPAGFYNIRVYDRNDGVCEGTLDGNCTDCFEVLEAICPTPVLNLSPESFCADDDVVMGLSGGSPMGGVYSGPGVTDDGNGETYSFDATAAGVGIHIITYSLTLSDDCMVSASGEVVVLPLATATFTALEDLCVDAGVQSDLGGGEPVGGGYSGPGVTDDGNGETYSFDPAAAGVGVHDISYTYDPSLEAQRPILGFGSSFIGEMMGDRFGQSSDISQDGSVLAIGAPSFSSSGFSTNGQVTVYEFSGSDWVLRDSPLLGSEDDEGFGTFVSLSDDGNRLLVMGSSSSSVFTTTIQVYDWDGSAWVQVGQQLDNFASLNVAFSLGGVQLAGDGESFIMINKISDGVLDEARIYDLIANTWTLTFTISESSGGYFDCKMSADGNRVAFQADNLGIQIWERNGAVWEQLGTTIDDPLQPGIGAFNILIGGLSADGSRVLFSRIDEENFPDTEGQVWVFEWNGSDWVQVGDPVSVVILPDAFGITSTDLSADGNRFCATFARPESEENGLFVYDWDGSAWNLVGAGVTDEFLDGRTAGRGVMSGDGTTFAVRTITGDNTSVGTAIGLVGTFRITEFCPDLITVVDQVEVFDLPNVNLSTVAGYCLDAPIANAPLTGGSPSGGVYSGPGVTDLGNGTQYNFDPMAVGTGVFTITYTFTDANGCVNSATSDIEVFDCAFEVTDPCACLDNATIIDLDAGTGGDDGQFSEVVSVSNAAGGMLPANQTWTVTAASGAFDAYNVPAIGVQSAGVPVATDGSVTMTFNAGSYELPFVHVDDQGYSITVEGPFGQGSAANVTLTISNNCQYPNPVFDPALPDFICSTEPAITLDGIDTNGGTDDAITFTINGAPATQFDPVALGVGFYTVVMTYDGADDGNGSVSPDGGITPASPGCTQTVQKVVEVGGLPPILTCPADDFGLPAGCNPAVPVAATTINLLRDPNPDPALPTVEDGCGTLTLTSSDEISDNGCTRTITRTYTITDQNGDSDTCEQAFTFIVDTDSPTFNEELPMDMTVECDAVPMAATLTASDNCTPDIMVSFNEVRTDDTCPQEFTLTRTWTTDGDDCGNPGISHTQVITVEDITAPTPMCNTIRIFLNEAGMYTLTQADIDEIAAGASDNCDDDFTYSIDQTMFNCDDINLAIGAIGGAEVEMTFVDCAGNTSMCTAIVEIDDSAVPFNFACIGDINITLGANCATTLTPEMVVTGFDDCIDSYNIMVDGIETDQVVSCGDHTYMIELVEDGEVVYTCWGNIFAEDKTAPTLECPDNTGSVTMDYAAFQTSGELTAVDPSLELNDYSCLVNNSSGLPLTDGEHNYDLVTFTTPTSPVPADVYTFLLETNFAGGGFDDGQMYIFQGDFSADDPCQNIIANLGDSFIPALGNPFDPGARFSLPLRPNTEYVVLITNFDDGSLGPWTLTAYSDNGTVLGGDFTPTNVTETRDLLCDDLGGVQFLFPESWVVDGDGNLDASATRALNDWTQAELNEFLAKLGLTGIPAAMDNCGDVLVTVSDEVEEEGDCGSLTLTRTFTASDRYDGACMFPTSPVLTTSCTQTITFRRPTIADDVVFPPNSAIIECDEDYPVDANGNPAPEITGYPWVRTATGFVDLSQSYCNLGASYSDEPRIETCEGSFNFRREWNVVNWCDPSENTTFDQYIKVGDYTGPEITGIPGVINVSTSPFSCEANVLIPIPDVADANGCSSAEATSYTVLAFGEAFFAGGNINDGDVVSAPIGEHILILCAVDACGNETCEEYDLVVTDEIEPTAVCNDELNVSIGGGDVANGVEGIARVFAVDFDEGSNDNCSEVTLEVRRNFWRNGTCDASANRFSPWGDLVFRSNYFPTDVLVTSFVCYA
ncbi:MAG: hypothetical protein AAFP77_08000 [Bacteroidota bacterium]